MDLEFMILDTFDSLRPNFCKFQSEQEANEACIKIIEVEETLGCPPGNTSAFEANYDKVQKVINRCIRGKEAEYNEEDEMDSYSGAAPIDEDYYYGEEEESTD